MARYVKCPRCELNYIDEEAQEYCDVCLAEMAGNKLQFADLEDEYDDMELERELCPICGVNYIEYGEKMCEECASKFDDYEEEEDIDEEKDEEWSKYLDDDVDDLSIDEEELDKALRAEFDSEFGDDESEEDFYEEENFDEDEEVDLDGDFDDDFDDDDDDLDDDDDDIF